LLPVGLILVLVTVFAADDDHRQQRYGENTANHSND